MAKFALCVELKAKPGKESEVEAFLKKEAVLASGEPGTVSWCAAKDEGEPGVYVIFDTFCPTLTPLACNCSPYSARFRSGLSQSTAQSRYLKIEREMLQFA